jgi:hypothetical protein
VTRVVALVLALAACLAAAAPAAAQASAADRHEGYYYPKVTSRETWPSRAKTLPDTDRRKRVAFATGIAKQMSELPYPATYSFFVKGDDADKLIIVANQDGTLNTPYRARALLATLTAFARLTPLFAEFAVEDLFTFLDLCKLLGIKQVTVSDGRGFAHQVRIR